MKPLYFLAGLLLGLLLAIGFSGRAQDYVIGSGLAIHLDHAHHCNVTTWGLGYEHQQATNWRAQVGFYRNSNCRWSTYAAEAWMPLRLGAVSAGVLAGVVTGYRAEFSPAAGFVTAYNFGKWKLNVITIPPSGESGKGVVWIQAGLQW